MEGAVATMNWQWALWQVESSSLKWQVSKACSSWSACEVLWWWSHWAENPQSRGTKRHRLSTWCPDTQRIRAACQIGSECHIIYDSHFRFNMLLWNTDETKWKLQQDTMSTHRSFAWLTSLTPWELFPVLPSAIAINWWKLPFPIRWLWLVEVPLQVALLWKASAFLIQSGMVMAFNELQIFEKSQHSSIQHHSCTDWVTIIEHGAFEGCASLESIILPVGEALVAFSLKAALLWNTSSFLIC